MAIQIEHSSFLRKSTSRVASVAAMNSASTTDSDTHFCVTDFQATGFPYTNATDPEVLFLCMVASLAQFASLCAVMGLSAQVA